MNAGAIAIRLGEYCHQTSHPSRPSGPALTSIECVLRKLQSAKATAASLGIKLALFACTEAKTAVAIDGNGDACDQRYLSGATTQENLQGYCGGTDAAIARCLMYAPTADVLCYKSTGFNPLEARKFAMEIRTAFPTKRLAFCYSSRLFGEQFSEADHAERERQVKLLGFDHYFYTQFGSIVFPHLPAERTWAIFSDSIQSQNGMEQNHGA
ncbi:MAG: hypothetical protein JSS95_01245 [Acidobacteria bacterium]|nr:hypothetical protein [Acidobacteriota bacterium]